jgi:hypothetical protein
VSVLRDNQSSARKVIRINNCIHRSIVVFSLCKRGVLLGIGIDEPPVYESNASELEQLEFTTETSWPERRDTCEEGI